MIVSINLQGAVWIEKTHNDFADGWEYYYVNGDTTTVWNNNNLRIWHTGAYIYSPEIGGLRIIGRDWDLDNNGWLDVLLTWDYANKVDIYWNSASGFNTSNKKTLFGLSNRPQGISVGDINTDGYEDAIIASYTAGGGNSRFHIFHGSSSGYLSTADDSILPSATYVQHPCLADINNDGYLDLIISCRYRIYIYYGPGPFSIQSPADSICFGSEVAHRLTIADVNYDGKLDIIVSFTSGGDGVRIYWGPSFTLSSTLSSSVNWDHSVADLNKDGYLDIYINQNGSSDIIYWGSATGFNTSTSIAGNGYGDCSIEDINGDGELDIAANQMGVASGYIMWGPNYTSYISLPSASSYPPSVMVADFDNNGEKDVIFGGTGGPTYLYWNNGGFSSTNKFTFPDYCDDAIFEDLGNLWDRSNKERYLSSIFYTLDLIKVDSVKWWGNFPAGIGLELYIRGTSDTNLWNPWIMLSNGGTDTTLSKINYLQYKCLFYTDYKQTSLFSFDSVKVYYDTLPGGIELKEDAFKLNIEIYPNPFSKGEVTSPLHFMFTLPEEGKVNLTIYNLAGEKIKDVILNKYYSEGLYTKLWNATDNCDKKLLTGIYIYKLKFIGNNNIMQETTKKFIIF